ncbi:MAG: prepilin-type N-terminal cleavage/methylation domain-containing protein [Acidimicrobiia bacterium]|nr:prepilin-type N-terminal cleavage/methylation domain-containing protein [Acidimicrobiia bacterium]
MLKAMRSRLNKDEGFTLIELMVVVLIIAILVAIAIPTFLGQRKNAQDSAAKSNVRNALATEKAYFSVNQAFTADVDELAAIEPNLFKTNGTDASDDPVSAIVATDASSVCLQQTSDSGVHFAVWDGTTAGTTYYQGATVLTACSATQPSGTGWSTGGW